MERVRNGQCGARSSKPSQNSMVKNKLLLRRVRISKADEVYDMKLEEGKKFLIAADVNEVAYTELILSINDKSRSGKVVFNLVKG
jgi:hypothetical protein